MKYLLVLCFLVLALGLHHGKDIRHIHLRHHSFHTVETPQFHEETEHLENYVHKFHPDTHFEWMVHVVAPATPEKKQAIEKFIGSKLGNYLPHNSYFMSGPKAVAEKARKAPGVLWVGSYKPEHKIPETMLHGKQYKDYRFNIHCHHTQDIKALAAKWEKEYPQGGATFKPYDTLSIIAELRDPTETPHFAEFIAKQPETHWIERRSVYEFANKWGVPITQGATCSGLGANPSQAYLDSFPTRTQINGKNVVIEINDQGLNEAATCYFPNQGGFHPASETAVDGTSGHGTAVAATAAGYTTGAGSDHNGVAPGAQILANNIRSTDGPFELPVPVRGSLDTWFNKGDRGLGYSNISIMLQAFASDTASDYTQDTLQVDDWAYGRQNVLLIFPAGNNGASGSRSVSSIASAKNVLTVGGSMTCTWDLQRDEPIFNQQNLQNENYWNSETVYTYSGRGPTSDGRIKPDVLAPAFKVYTADVTATAGPCSVKQFNGTSFSAGFAAGAAALVRDYLLTLYHINYNTSGPEEVSAAQIKAILINSGVAMTGIDVGRNGETKIGQPLHFNTLSTRRNDYSGFGRISLGNTLWFNTQSLDKRMLLERSFNAEVKNQGDTIVYCFECKAASCKIKVTLVWTDPAGDVNTGIALVSDLDLAVSSRIYGITWKGNQDKQDLSIFDSKNNVEQVEGVFQTGVYQILVYGATLPVGPQQYALVASGDLSFVINSIPANPKNCPVAAVGQNYLSPNNCSYNGNSNPDGTCSCVAPFFGVDCSAARCGSNCVIEGERRGTCDYDTSTCKCLEDFSGSDCSVRLAPREEITPCSSGGVSTGLLIGAIIAALLVGLLFGGILGWFIAIKYLENQRRKRRQQLINGGQG